MLRTSVSYLIRHSIGGTVVYFCNYNPTGHMGDLAG